MLFLENNSQRETEAQTTASKIKKWRLMYRVASLLFRVEVSAVMIYEHITVKSCFGYGSGKRFSLTNESKPLPLVTTSQPQYRSGR